MTIIYTTGDATRPVGEGAKIIAHVVNDEGKWGSGFVVALSKRWPQPEREYRAWRKASIGATDNAGVLNPFCLGALQMVLVDAQQELWVANMVAQRGVRHAASAPRAVDYDALRQALERLGAVARFSSASVHMPRIGCGLGGGSWDEVERLVKQELAYCGVPVTVYDLPEAS